MELFASPESAMRTGEGILDAMREQLNLLNSHINTDCLVTNNTGRMLHAIIQLPDESFAVVPFSPGSTVAAEGILADTDNNGTIDKAARVYNGAGLKVNFTLIEEDNALSFISPDAGQAVTNAAFHAATHVLNNNDYLEFLPLDEFVKQNPLTEDAVNNARMLIQAGSALDEQLLIASADVALANENQTAVIPTQANKAGNSIS